MDFRELLSQGWPTWLVGLLGALYYIFSCAVGSIKMPNSRSTPKEWFWFGFLNRLAANPRRAKAGERHREILNGLKENSFDSKLRRIIQNQDNEKEKQ